MATATRTRKRSAKRAIKSGAGALRFLASAQAAYIEALVDQGEAMFDLTAQLREAAADLRKARDEAITAAQQSDSDMGEEDAE